MNRIDLAKSLHQEHCSCAQAILVAYHQELGTDELTAYKIGDGLGAGYGKLRGLCGAVNAMGMVISAINSGTLQQKGATKEHTMTEVRACAEQFTAEYHSLLCSELLESNRETRTCNDLVAGCAQIIENYLAAQKRGI
ncbi:hypothetical protein SDC9_82784 [bioreactor metagenome]|uniref:C_GCAxxG_C_C family protein n=1 Tax=bioreactor metagenome TaxID=1076179 RepID=A0A644Z6F1_9ZZZZ|nr:C-GCAxxG-C-C family protein [Erysipelotrichaceae bacterium]